MLGEMSPLQLLYNKIVQGHHLPESAYDRVNILCAESRSISSYESPDRATSKSAGRLAMLIITEVSMESGQLFVFLFLLDSRPEGYRGERRR